jgi:putative selenate reductase molybdopterin-binding subunit
MNPKHALPETETTRRAAIKSAIERTDDRAGAGEPAWTTVGENVVKVDGVKLAKGRGTFTDDVAIPGLLWGKIVASPHAHARIRSIDVSRARAVPGVRAVLTHQDVLRVPHTTAGQSYPEPSPYDAYLLDAKVRFVGDRVALIAADTRLAAEEAAEALLASIEWEVLPAVFDAERAMQPGAPVLHDEPDSKGIKDAACNLQSTIDFATGDVEAALAESDVVIDRTYELGPVQHANLETHVAIAYLDEDERLFVRTSTQVPYHTRRIIAPELGLPVSKVRVVKPRIGGGFGNKQEMLLEDAAGALALATRRPVKIENTREDEFRSSRTRHAMRIRVRLGAMRSGEIRAIDMQVLSSTGAYGTHGFTVTGCAGSKVLPLYRAKALRFHADIVYTNRPVAGAFRGYGAPQGFYAVECAVDEAAHALGVDPLLFRKNNVIREGDMDPVSVALGEGGHGFPRRMNSYGLVRCIDDGAREIGWARRNPTAGAPAAGAAPARRRGIGVALAMQGSGIAGVDWGSASCKINEDGSWNVTSGATDIGTGADTVLAQIAAETLGVTLDKIVIYTADTDLTPFDVGAYASSITYVSGGAVLKACEDARRQSLEFAGRMLTADPATLVAKNNRVTAPDGRFVTMSQVALHSMYTEHHQIIGTGSHCSPDSPPPFAAGFAEVEVDTDTGEVKLLRYVAAVDCGTAINPMQAEGQAEGATAMGVGYALCEEMLFDEMGRMRNPSFLDYKIPSPEDLPDVKALLVDTYEPTGPYGAKAVAEVPINPPAPAIANAVFNAIGVRIRSIPLTPEVILKALGKL